MYIATRRARLEAREAGFLVHITKKNMTHSIDASKHLPITLLFCFGVVMMQLYLATTFSVRHWECIAIML